jgi:biotin transport system substrate-specific component
LAAGTSSEARRSTAAHALAGSRVWQVAAVLAFVALTAIAARLAVPVPGSPVPVTLQTLAVSLAGALLGPGLGAASQALYVALGAVGAPVFAVGGGIGYLMGPTGGYLLAFPLAAAVTGLLAGNASDRSVRGTARLGIAIFLGTVVIFGGGWLQLALLTHDPARAFAVGVQPFLLGDVLKVLVALVIARPLRATLGLR